PTPLIPLIQAHSSGDSRNAAIRVGLRCQGQKKRPSPLDGPFQLPSQTSGDHFFCFWRAVICLISCSRASLNLCQSVGGPVSARAKPASGTGWLTGVLGERTVCTSKPAPPISRLTTSGVASVSARQPNCRQLV